MSFPATIVAWIQTILGFLYSAPIIGYYLDLFSLFFTASVVRCGSGLFCAEGTKNCRRPQKLLQLYEHEGCPFCRKVRETLCVLDLDAIVYPCPRETFGKHGYLKDSRFRTEAKRLGGKCQFPMLVDPNEEGKGGKPLIMYESSEIINCLWTKYGDRATKPLTYRMGSNPISFGILMVSSVLRCFPEHGLLRIPSKTPNKPLEFYGVEPNCFCKKIREILSSLKLPYVLRTSAGGTQNEMEIGIFGEPLLKDPNTGIQLKDAESMKQYLIKTYQDGEFQTTESISAYIDSKKKA